MKSKWNLEAFAELGRMVSGEACELGAWVEPETEVKAGKRVGRAQLAGQAGKKLPKLPRKYSWQAPDVVLKKHQ